MCLVGDQSTSNNDHSSHFICSLLSYVHDVLSHYHFLAVTYENKELKTETEYSFSQRSIAEDGSAEAYEWTKPVTIRKRPEPGAPIAAIVGSIVAIILLVLIVVSKQLDYSGDSFEHCNYQNPLFFYR